MEVETKATSIKYFINELSKEALKLQSNTEVINTEKYNIKTRISRYKDDQHCLMQSSMHCVDLATVRKRKECLDLRASNVLFRRNCSESLKYALSDAPWKHAMVKKEQEVLNAFKIEKDYKINGISKEKENAIKNEVTECEVIITLHYHKPIVTRQKLSVHREIQVLGSTLLTDLRDFLPCYSDELFLEPVRSLEKNIKENKTTKSKFKSGYIFIENVFYNDLRDPTSIDYSRVVLDWVEKKKYGTGFTTVDMNMVQMRDLYIRQNESYLYCHQGDCEHIITITDIRLLNSRIDITDPAKYPLETLKRQERKAMCSVCHLVTVQWVVTKSVLCPEIPCFLCDQCLRMLCFSEHGKLLDPNTVVHLFPQLHS